MVTLVSYRIVTVGGPNITTFPGDGRSVHLRCFVQFHDVIRSNARVMWLTADNKPMPLAAVTAMTATVKSPRCRSSKGRRYRRDTVRAGRQTPGGKYKCRVTWDPPRPFLPVRVHHDFLTVAASKSVPLLELCIATDPCGKSTSLSKTQHRVFYIVGFI